MSIPGSASPLFFTAAADAAAGANIIKSVRFNRDDTAYLNKTFSSDGNRRKFTYSFWVKRTNVGLSEHGVLIEARVTGTPSADSDAFSFRFDNSDRIRVADWGNFYITSTSRFRDPSAWYHLVLSVDTAQASNNISLYVNGVLNKQGTYAQNTDTRVNAGSGTVHEIGTRTYGYPSDNYYLDAQLADFYFIDGQALDPTSFGAFDDNGLWQASSFSGSFGTNGFHLFDFANESGIGNDSSGNDNDFSVNNISSTAGRGNDVLFDVPANGSADDDSGAGGEVSGNWAVWNPLSSTGNTDALSNGNLDVQNTTTTYDNIFASFGMPSGSGSYYWEFENVHNTGNCHIGIAKADANLLGNNFVGGVTGTWAFGDSGYRWSEGSFASGGSGFATTGMIVGIVFNSTTGVMSIYLNGTLDVSITGITDSAIYYPVVYTRSSGGGSFNFGQRPFEHSENVPSGAKLLCSTLASTPTITKSTDYFDVKSYSGTGAAQTVDGFDFSPDFVWLKRTSSSESNTLFDTVRGAGKEIISDSTSGEYDAGTGSAGSLIAFNSDGFDLGTRSSVNGSSTTNVAFAWDAGSSTVSNTDGDVTSQVRVNQSVGCSIVTWNPSANGQSVGHGLNAVPELIWAKALDNGHSWRVYHKGLSSGKNLLLDTKDKEETYTADIDVVSSTVFDGGQGLTGSSLNDNVAYCFTSVKQFSAFGIYEGNSVSGNGTFVPLDFAPAFVMVKNIDAASTNWTYWNWKRPGYNLNDDPMFANLTDGEGSSYRVVDLLSNGFKLRDPGGNSAALLDTNTSGDTYIYAAWAAFPFHSNGGLAR